MAADLELLGNRAMVDKETGELDGGNLGDTGLHEHIAHWAEVLDRWVQGVDTRLGRLPRIDVQSQASSAELDGDPMADSSR